MLNIEYKEDLEEFNKILIWSLINLLHEMKLYVIINNLFLLLGMEKQ